MSETQGGYVHKLYGETDVHIPPNFLGIDQSRSAISANHVRGNGDLAIGLEMLSNDFVAWSSYADCIAYETNKTPRDIRRGAIVAYQLLRDSVSEFSSTNHFSKVIALDNEENKLRKTLIDFRRKLMHTRQSSLDDANRNKDNQAELFTTMVNRILEVSGLSGSFDTAIENLRGTDLEGGPTILPEARYGAALIVLGVGGYQ